IKVSAAGCFEGKGYDGMPAERNYRLAVHAADKPAAVSWKLDGGTVEALREAAEAKALESLDEGWYFEPGRGGIVHVKLKPQDARAAFSVEIRK
ncbi:MAG: hypothetical protein JW843_08340, partial [Candidatus Aminicenantes bacterium]|nr:hypothetical protein [Candidatus Aminicenantes bacterium]